MVKWRNTLLILYVCMAALKSTFFPMISIIETWRLGQIAQMYNIKELVIDTSSSKIYVHLHYSIAYTTILTHLVCSRDSIHQDSTSIHKVHTGVRHSIWTMYTQVHTYITLIKSTIKIYMQQCNGLDATWRTSQCSWSGSSGSHMLQCTQGIKGKVDLGMWCNEMW